MCCAMSFWSVAAEHSLCVTSVRMSTKATAALGDGGVLSASHRIRVESSDCS